MKFFSAILISILCLASSRAAVSFDGTDDFIRCPNITAMNSLPACSVSVWVTQTTLTAAKTFVSKYDPTPGAGIIFQTGTASKSNIIFCVSGPNLIETTTGAFALPNVWYHLVGIFDSAVIPRLTIYINGVTNAVQKLGTPDGVATSGASTNYLNIGRLNSTTGRYWNGQISDVRIYNRALSKNEVIALYASRLKWITPTDGLIGYWPLDEAPNGNPMNNLLSFDRISGNHGIGDDGANNTGLSSAAEFNLTNP